MKCETQHSLSRLYSKNRGGQGKERHTARMKRIVKSFAFIIVLIFGFFLFITSNNIAGMRSFIVKSGSMEPAIPIGALVITQRIHPSLLEPGDVITYIRPTEEKDFITHRVLGVSTQNEYVRIQTKGDHNLVPDTWQVSGGNVIGRVQISLPWFGFALAFMQSKIGILLFILIPASFILVEEISTIIKIVRKEDSLSTIQATIPVIVMLSLLGIYSMHTPTTQAVLSDSSQVGMNTFRIVSEITPTPITQQCGGRIDKTITGNGTGSINSVLVNNTCQSVTSQTNNQQFTNDINTLQGTTRLTKVD